MKMDTYLYLTPNGQVSLIENDVETPLLKAIVTFFEILFIIL